VSRHTVDYLQSHNFYRADTLLTPFKFIPLPTSYSRLPKMAPHEYKPLMNLSLFYSIIVILCADAQPGFQTFLFFSTCIFHAALSVYLSPSLPLPLKKRPSGLVRGMTGVIQLSHGRSKPVRIHEMLGRHHSKTEDEYLLTALQRRR